VSVSWKIDTYWEDYDDILLPFYHNCEVEAYFEAFECLMDEDVLD
jgi:hypothetical protein